MTAAIGRFFMEQTVYEYMAPAAQERGEPPPPLELPCRKGARLIELPPPVDYPATPVDLGQLIAQRTSVRKYARTPLTQAELSFLLWCAQGVKEVIPGRATLRTVPSAGARHAFETYVLANNVKGLAPGLYRFLALDHQLAEENLEAGFADGLVEACLGQTFVKTSAATFIWTAVPYRMTWRYGERGYRYLHLDAGHSCQNLYLAAEAIGGGACAIAAYEDEAMNACLGLDGKEQFVIYVAPVGKKP